MTSLDAAGDVSSALRGLLAFVRCRRRNLNGEPLSFVGEGYGRYEKVEKLIWVGLGKGNINIADEPQGQKNPKESSCNLRCDWGLVLIGFVLLLVTVGTVCLGISLFGPRVDAGTAEARAAAAAARRPSGAGASSQFTIRAQASSSATNSGGSERHRGGEDAAPAASSSSGCSGSVEAWSDPKKMWCCHQRGAGCPESMCKAAYFAKGIKWSEGRRGWCCSHFGHGCPEGASSSSSPMPSHRALNPMNMQKDRKVMQEAEEARKTQKDRKVMQEAEEARKMQRVLERMDMERAAQLPAGQGEGGDEAFTADGRLA